VEKTKEKGRDSRGPVGLQAGKRIVPEQLSRDPFEGLGIISDPIHGYIHYTRPKPGKSGEVTEEALLDHPWLQRLRYIRQLQSAFWVYPTAEHSRFQHSLGVMHVAGRFARHLYPSLKAHYSGCPSEAFVEELLRLAGLLHDVGHGPFSHLCDSEYLEKRWGINHEILGGRIITNELSGLVEKIKRSPSGAFQKGEKISPSWIAYLITRPANEAKERYPQWFQVLRLLFSSGIFTVDNLDFVLRDSYMTGFSKDPIDLERILYHTFVTEKGVTYSSYGRDALIQFIQTRINLFNAIYYHRTTRAFDHSIKNLFYDTLRILLPKSPLENLTGYLRLTEFSLFHLVQEWAVAAKGRRKELGEKWRLILQRQREWVTAYEKRFFLDSRDRNSVLADLFLRRDTENMRQLESMIRARLPKKKVSLPFVLDLASQDPRPDNPLDEKQIIWLFDHSRNMIERESLAALLTNVPYRIIVMRILAPNHEEDRLLSHAAEAMLSEGIPSYTTNI
jgi:HD superfamily phosphohydrolase